MVLGSPPYYYNQANPNDNWSILLAPEPYPKYRPLPPGAIRMPADYEPTDQLNDQDMDGNIAPRTRTKNGSRFFLLDRLKEVPGFLKTQAQRGWQGLKEVPVFLKSQAQRGFDRLKEGSQYVYGNLFG